MRYLFFFWIVMLSQLAEAQNILKPTDQCTLQWGEAIKVKKRGRLLDIVGKSEQKHFALLANKKGYSIQVLSQELKIIEEVPIELGYNGKTMTFEGITQLDDKFIIFTSFSNLKLKKNFLFYKTVPLNNVSKNSELTKIGELDYAKKRSQGYFNYTISKDSSKILIYYAMPYVTDGPERFGFTVLNKNMEQIWQKDITLPYNNSLFNVEQFKVSNTGDVHIVGTAFRANKRINKRNGEANYTYHLISYTQKGEKIKDYELDLEQKFVTDLQFAIDNDNTLRCGGFYSENGTFSIKGTFYISIDVDAQEIVSASYKEFPENFVTNGWTDREITKAKKHKERKGKALEMYEYDLRDFILKDDGGIVMLAEQYYVRVITSTSFDAQGRPNTRTTYHYYYNDIIAISINKNGNIEWQTKIDKYQHTINDYGYYSSFATAIINDKIHIVFNQSAKAIYDKETYKDLSREDKKANFTLMVTVNNDGSTEKESLFDLKKNTTRTRPKVSEQTSSNQMLLYTRWGKKENFVQLDFK